MPCTCPAVPGAALREGGDFSSGLIQKIEDNAVRCGYKGTNNSFPGPCLSCSAPIKPVANATTSGEYTTKVQTIARDCPIDSKIGKSISSGQYTNSLQKSVIDCSIALIDPTRRFSQYQRFFPPPCPPTPAEQLNSTIPKPPIGDCQPSRFF